MPPGLYQCPPPSLAAVMARMPEPVPTSRTLCPLMAWDRLSAALRHILVEAWEPVPNAMPGSISIIILQRLFAAFLHVGFIIILLETLIDLIPSFHLLSQSASPKIHPLYVHPYASSLFFSAFFFSSRDESAGMYAVRRFLLSCPSSSTPALPSSIKKAVTGSALSTGPEAFISNHFFIIHLIQ